MNAPPVLLLIFNRPDCARMMLEALRTARPSRLFVAADGPRTGHPTDVERCAAARAVMADIDWPCQVTTLFHDTNVGLTRAVVSAVSWFFEHVESGIILEDDCVPVTQFFSFAGELLERYRDDVRVMHVSGLNMAPGTRFSPHSYFFVETGHIWGWATWRRAWRQYDESLGDWPAMRHEFGFTAPPLRRALGRKFASAWAGRKATWSRAWYYSMFRHDGLAIVPSTNLIENVGFGEAATHTKGGHHPLRHKASGDMTFPLVHPPDLSVNAAYTSLLARYHYGSYARRAGELAWSVADRLTGRAR